MSGLLLCLLFSLASIQQISATHHQTYLHHETQHTLKALEHLPSHCTQDVASLIRTEQSKLPGQVFYCSISSLVIDLAEILVDTVYFGIEAFVAVPSFVKDLKGLRTCLNESSAEDIVTCALEYLPGTVEAGRVIVAGVENYVGEMELIVPLLVEQIEQCKTSSVSQYKVFLESVLAKATTCAQ